MALKRQLVLGGVMAVAAFIAPAASDPASETGVGQPVESQSGYVIRLVYCDPARGNPRPGCSDGPPPPTAVSVVTTPDLVCEEKGGSILCDPDVIENEAANEGTQGSSQ